jgi:hypothetical protein
MRLSETIRVQERLRGIGGRLQSGLMIRTAGVMFWGGCDKIAPTQKSDLHSRCAGYDRGLRAAVHRERAGTGLGRMVCHCSRGAGGRRRAIRVVCVEFRRCRSRYPSPDRCAEEARHGRAVPLRAKPDVCGRLGGDPWLGDALSIHGHLEIRVRRGTLLSSFRHPLGRTASPPGVRRGIR